jgi:hypothetical protein
MVIGRTFIGGAINKNKSLWVGLYLYPYNSHEHSRWEINVSASTQELADKYSSLKEKSWATADEAKAEADSLLRKGDIPLLPWEENEAHISDPPTGRSPR